MTKVVIAEPANLAPDISRMLSALGPIAMGPFERAELLAAVAGAEVLMVRLTHQIDEEVLTAAPRLRAVVSATTGTNHIDLEACAARGIAVVTLRGETAFLDGISSTAEHTFGLILALMRQTVAAHGQVLRQGFARDGRTGRELSGKTLGVVGCGRLGGKVARYGKCFGMNVIGHDPHVTTEDIPLVELPELLTVSDIVSLHASHEAGQPVLLNAEAFAMMKEGAVLVNTARGELIDEGALLDALAEGKLAAAALDVAAGETHRPVPDPLVTYAKKHDNLLLTPHIGGATYDALHKAEIFAVRKLEKLLENEN